MKKIYILLAFAAVALSASAQWAKVFTTKPDLSLNLTQQAVRADNTKSTGILINPEVSYQTIDGFGYAITYSAAYNLLKMNQSERTKLLTRTFSPTNGFGVSYVRMSIGTSDFASREYSLCDTKGPDSNKLQNFALQSDETNYVIPILKEILAINPGLKIIATPWSPPLWMKTGYSWTGQELRSDCYDVYGDYFVKFLQAMSDNGIKIYAVTPQNEPMNRGNSASCYMPWQTAADFVKSSLAPKIKNAGFNTKIYLWDHNYNYDNISDQEDYPYKALQRMGTNFTGYDLIAGTAWHKYTGYDNDWAEMLDIAGKTGKENLFTEASIGSWNNAGDLGASLSRDMNDLVINPQKGMAVGSLAWNFVLDTNHGPYRPGGCSTCAGAINFNTNGTVNSYESHYFIMAHASAAVKPGARRVMTQGEASTLNFTGYVNPDGTYALLASNNSNTAISTHVTAGTFTYPITVPAKSIVSAVFGLNRTEAEPGIVDNDNTVIYFDNSSTNWSTPTVFTWLPGGSDNSWPGQPMTYVANSIWRYDVPNTHTMAVFNAGDGDPTKTGDFDIINNHVYNKWGDQGRINPADISDVDDFDHAEEMFKTPVYLSGDFTGWAEPGTSGSIAMKRDGNLFKASVNFNGQGRFCIYGTKWLPKYCVDQGTAAVTAPVNDMQLRLERQNGQDQDVSYNLNGAHNVYFNPTTLQMSIKRETATIIDTIDGETVTTTKWYDLQGRPVANPTPGAIYIRVSDSKSQVVVM